MLKVPEILDYINEHIVPISGVTSAGIASTSVEYHADFLIKNGFFGLAFSEWIQVVSVAYVMLLFVTTIIKLIKKDGKK